MQAWIFFFFFTSVETKTYVVQRLRYVVFDYIHNPNISVDHVPTYEDILSCIDCTIDLRVAGKSKLWTWYCNCLVLLAAGHADAFGMSLKCFERI